MSNKTVDERFYYTDGNHLTYAEVIEKSYRWNPVSGEFDLDRLILRSKSIYYFTGGKLLYFVSENYKKLGDAGKGNNHAKKILRESEMFLGAAKSTKGQINIESYLKNG